MNKGIYRGANVIIFVYDITSSHSFEEIKNYWYKEVKNYFGEKKPILAIVGNNNDQFENQVVNEVQRQNYADEIGAFFQTTYKGNDYGISELFDCFGKKYFNPRLDYKKENKEMYKRYLIKKEKSKKNVAIEEYDNIFPISITSHTIQLKGKKHKQAIGKLGKKVCIII